VSGRDSILVLIGDGAPHPGTRGACEELAARAKGVGAKTFVVSARAAEVEREVKGFAEIATAGGGQLVRMHEGAALPALLLGGEFSDAWKDLLASFRERCDALAR
jgi:hypothetical protein